MALNEPYSSHGSPFLQPTNQAESRSVAVLHLRRDQLIPVILCEVDDEDQGYDEGKVTNTRFGSFPHSTLIGVPWGSQIRASNVDTGSRGRRTVGQKRKHNELESFAENPSDFSEAAMVQSTKLAVAAQTGFAYLLPPTPETWTISLPHRTQVVYTPDYSLILQKLKVRPGTELIEAGSGSGSFSHAAARAVYNGVSTSDTRKGRVWSFEFHQQRAEKLRTELKEHRLEEVVEVTHRDVYEDGFIVSNLGEQIVQANAVFLDLPAPWLALPRLKRSIKAKETDKHENGAIELASVDRGSNKAPETFQSTIDGPLASQTSVHLCCFLPCIEQVQRTVTALQSHCWEHISVVDVASQRIEVRRERTGTKEEGLRGVNSAPSTVEEALTKHRDDENRTQMFHQISQRLANGGTKPAIDRNGVKTKQQRLREIQEASEQRKIYKEGRLIHRPESELKLHTSYLVFAVLPREWTERDELKATQLWSKTIDKTKAHSLCFEKSDAQDNAGDD